MKAVGIIAEFKPLHRGHAHLLQSVKSHFPDRAIVCVMSGNFVQRGEFAIQEKYSRARSALECGADLVLELPYPFSSLSAEGFAASGIHILSSLPAVDTIAFGTEIDNTHALKECAKNLSSFAFRTAFRKRSATDKTKGYPALQYEVYRELFGEEEILLNPNASLAVQYLTCLSSYDRDYNIFPVLRHEGKDTCSASQIRALLLDKASVESFVPSASFSQMEAERASGRFPVSMETLAPILFYLLKTKDRKELLRIYGLAPLTARAKNALKDAESIEDLVQMTVSTSYTASRVRRAFLSLLCDNPRGVEKELPAYTLLLGSTPKGRDLLAEMRKTSRIPVFSKPSHALRSQDMLVKAQAKRAFGADEIYAMAFPCRQREGFFLRTSPVSLPNLT